MYQSENGNNTDILRQAEALRAEAISNFFTNLFSRKNKSATTIPMNLAPAE